MAPLFTLTDAGEKGGKKQGVVGLEVTVAGRKTVCPVTEPCTSYEELAGAIEAVRADLDRVLGKAKEFFEGVGGGMPDVTPEMKREEVWSIIASVDDEQEFVAGFNGLDEDRRREIAEYVLSECNVFSGKAAVFSARYDSDTALME